MSVFLQYLVKIIKLLFLCFLDKQLVKLICLLTEYHRMLHVHCPGGLLGYKRDGGV